MLAAAGASLWRTMSWTASGGIFLMMLLGFADVLGRKLLGRPLRGSVELTELLMLLVVFLGVTIVSHRQQHVQLDLIDDRIPPRWQDLRARAGEFVSGLVMLGAGWISVTKAVVAGRQQEATSLLQLPLAPAYALVALLLAVAALAHFGLAFGRTPPTASGTLA
jgi:TRAP-type C4-dicarboxylate transport system permease small subunit